MSNWPRERLVETVRPQVEEAAPPYSRARLRGEAVLFLPEAFCRHLVTQVDEENNREWRFELGPAAEDAFDNAFRQRFSRVSVRHRPAGFPLRDHVISHILVVVEPSFVAFQWKYPPDRKDADGEVLLALDITAYDRDGNRLMQKPYFATGHGPARAAAAEALTSAAGQVADDVAAMLSDPFPKAS